MPFTALMAAPPLRNVISDGRWREFRLSLSRARVPPIIYFSVTTCHRVAARRLHHLHPQRGADCVQPVTAQVHAVRSGKRGCSRSPISIFFVSLC